MLSKRMDIGQIFSVCQGNVELSLGRAEALQLVASALTDERPDISRAIAALANDMIEDRSRVLCWMEQLIEATRKGEITGSMEF